MAEVCNPCAKLNKAQNDIVKLHKLYYEENGVEYYVYKKETNGDIYFVKKNQFQIVFDKDIKPNFEHGAEYWHISEFKGKA